VVGAEEDVEGRNGKKEERSTGVLTGKVLSDALGPTFAGKDVMAASDVHQADATDRPTVLVVDDEPMVRAIACRILVRAGYRVIEADGGVSAISQFDAEKDKVTLALVDSTMPGIDGPTVIRALLQRRAELPVVLFSGYIDEAGRTGLDKLDNVKFLAKPFSAASLLATIDAARSAKGHEMRDAGSGAR